MMSILVKIWIFELNFSTVLSFIVGLIFGMILLGLIYALLVVISIRDKKYKVEVNPDNLRQEEAIAMVKKAQDSFNDRELRGKLKKGEYFRRLTTDLVYGIASSFYPDSKYPLLEITIDEAIELMGYVQYRFDEILKKGPIKLIKRLKISTIFNVSVNAQSVVENKAFKATANVAEKASKVKKVIDTINPMKWFKRLVVDNAIRIITNKLYLALLGIIGEEAYKIYSKSVLKHEETIDTNVNEITDSIAEDIKEAMDELDEDDTNIRFKTKSFIFKESELKYQSNYDLNYKFMDRIVVEAGNEEQ